MTLILLLVLTQTVLAEGAGVLVFTNIDNQPHVLLADHKKASQKLRGWSTLGGTVKKNESQLEAAIREVYEESNGILEPELLKKLVNPNIKTIAPGFTIFFAEVPYQSVDNFNRAKAKNGINGHGERGPYIWVPWKEIVRASKQYQQLSDCDKKEVKITTKYLPKNSQTDWYFEAFLSTVELIINTDSAPLSVQ